ncbi:P-loop containing nucleoside triphosphate hydrolase protein [Globomyces pollinis-pini]|nr:P-loop containing nucleoside triphosphate hydrolase protein [Globomyces pollinis-pini]
MTIFGSFGEFSYLGTLSALLFTLNNLREYVKVYLYQQRDVSDDVITESTECTKIDNSLFFITLLQVIINLYLSVSSFYLNYLNFITFVVLQSSGWLILLLITYSVIIPKPTLPRYHTMSYLLALTGQTYCIVLIYKQQTNLNSFDYSVLVSFLLTLLLVLLDSINPSRNAELINSLKIDGRYPCEYSTASFYSKLSFSWVNSLLKSGSEKPLESVDIPHLPKSDQVDEIISDWVKFKSKPSKIIWKLIRFTRSFMVFQVFVSFISTILSFADPLFINLILRSIQQISETDDLNHYYYTLLLLILMFFCKSVEQLLNSQIDLNGRHWSIRLRTVLIYEIFQKSLKRTESAVELDDEDNDDKASQGKIVNLMSSDTHSIQYFITDLHTMIIVIPFSIAFSLVGLISVMGAPALSGLVVLILSGPLSSWTLAKYYKCQKESKKLCDRRIQLTNEALQGIRIIKFMAWENQFIRRILEARDNELKVLFNGWMHILSLWSISWCASILVVIVSLIFYTVVAGNTLDAATAFTSMNLLATVTWRLSSLSESVSRILNIRIVLGRINKFLEEQELEKYSDKNSSSNRDPNTWIGFKNATFGYYTAEKKEAMPTEETPLQADQDEPEKFKLRNINIVFPKGKISTIIGATGSGKTSLLLTLLGELKCYEGTYSISEHHLINDCPKSDIAYVPQTPWLMNGTIRENILFGETFDEVKYLQILRACALNTDLRNLGDGDQTEIGEKGVNLSGGQKQRISLARAVFSNASIILLDDPLSAVDAPTAKHLLNNCILKVLKGRTVILVTHAINLVFPKSDWIVIMRNGSVSNQGVPNDVANDDSLKELNQQSQVEPFGSNHEDSGEVQLINETSIKNEESKVVGAVKFKTYKSYIMACGGLLFVVGTAITYGSMTIFDYLANWWVEIWTDKLRTTFSITTIFSLPPSSNSTFYIGIYGIICAFEFIPFWFKVYVQYIGGAKASRTLHASLLHSILGSPMRFFEITPVGRIINRFSKDIDEIDSTIMWLCAHFGTIIVGCIGKVILVSFVAPGFISTLFFLYFYYRIAKFYLQSSRELKRIESVLSSPIYAQFGETLIGVSSIRAYGAERKSIKEILDKVENNNRAYFYLFVTNRWLMVRTSILSAFIVFLAGGSVLYSNLSAGWAGVAFNFASQITTTITDIIQYHSTLEMSLNSVERIDEYSELKKEDFDSFDGTVAPANWPNYGRIIVENLSVKYSEELPEVLKNVSFTIDSKEKVGIVGRTGAGKSTLSMAFFRILPFVNGTIIIDDIDISKLGLHDLRSKLTIIPQDPILFEGTLRSNLDPLDEHSDSKIWDALKHTHVLESIQTSKNNSISSVSLDTTVTENGKNFSQGQRQLLCLARALLRTSSIIFMDEATASVDPETDRKIQDTIRQEFKCTILTVAHRIQTVIDYDKIIVMDAGKVAEIGRPKDLMVKENGIFFQMCRESGNYDELYQLATSSTKRTI